MTSNTIDGYTIRTNFAGDASLIDQDGETIATLKRSEGGMVPNAGWWFALRYPSSAHMMAHQDDRWSYAAAWGRTRKECAEEFLGTGDAASAAEPRRTVPGRLA